MTTAVRVGDASVLRRKVRRVVGAKLAYNAAEAVVAIAAGALASSSALIGFGLDSIVEVLSALAIAWQFAGGRSSAAREHRALRLITLSFFGLAAFVSFESVRTLFGDAEPEHSTVGIVLAITSVIVMPGLALHQRRLGEQMGSASVVADSRQTVICAALSAVLLLGLLANSILGWSWADPVAALVIAAVACKEGVDAWRGDACCATGVLAAIAPADACVDGCAPASDR